MADVDPDVFKTRYHLDLLSRVSLYASLRALTASGLTAAQGAQVLARRLGADQAEMDDFLGKKYREPAQMALYAEQVAGVLQDMKRELAKIAKAMTDAGL